MKYLLVLYLILPGKPVEEVPTGMAFDTQLECMNAGMDELNERLEKLPNALGGIACIIKEVPDEVHT